MGENDPHGGDSPGQGQVEGQQSGVDTCTRGYGDHQGIIVSGPGDARALEETMPQTAMSGLMPVRVRGRALGGTIVW